MGRLSDVVWLVGQVEKIAALSGSQAWDGLQVVTDLPGRGRDVKVTRVRPERSSL